MIKKSNLIYSLSIVSHGQMKLINNLLSDLDQIYKNDFEIILTLNIPEELPILDKYCFPIRLLINERPLGFGANHNIASTYARGDYFAVVNPDLRAIDLVLNDLRLVCEHPSVGVCAPLVRNSQGGLEDSARYFPSFSRLFSKIILNNKNFSYRFEAIPAPVDWVAGMFMLFKRQTFQAIGGFDDRRFFMYYEDVDICHRLSGLGLGVFVQPSTFVVHDAQRASHRDLKHFYWHFISMLRYLTGI